MTGRSIDKAKDFLTKGQVVGIPTETVYGLAGNACDADVVKTIFAIKQRPHTSPLIIHTSSLCAAKAFVTSIPPQAHRLAESCWPGPLTLLLDKKPIIPSIVTAGLPTVGVRVPNHPCTLALLSSLPFPLAAPSANPFGYISPTTAAHVAAQLGDRIPYILDGGPCVKGLESTIVGFPNGQPVVYRLGSLTQEALEAILGPIPYIPPAHTHTDAHLAPGRTPQHYAPHTPIRIGHLPTLLAEHPTQHLLALCFDTPLVGLPPSQQRILSPQGSLDEAAQHLFDALRTLDQQRGDLIIAPRFPDHGLGRVINERLQRASHHP